MTSRRYGSMTEEELVRLLRPGLPWLSVESRRVFWGATGAARADERFFRLETQRVKMRAFGDRAIRRRPDASFGWRRGEERIGSGVLERALTPRTAKPPSFEEIESLASQAGAEWLAIAAPEAPRWMRGLICHSDFVSLSISYIGQAAVFLDVEAKRSPTSRLPLAPLCDNSDIP